MKAVLLTASDTAQIAQKAPDFGHAIRDGGLCVDCRATGIEVLATCEVNGKTYCSSHARKYTAAPEQTRGAGPKDKEAKVSIAEKLQELVAAGKSVAEIAETLGKSRPAAAAMLGYYHLSVIKRACAVPGCPKYLRSDNRSGMCAKHSCGPRRPSNAVITTEGGDSRTPKSGKGEDLPESYPTDTPPDATAHTAPAPAADGNHAGHARCRVAMFEVEGSADAVLSAVEAVKAALLRGLERS